MQDFHKYLPFHKSSIGQAYAVLPKDVGDWQWNTDSLRHIIQPPVKFFKFLIKHKRCLLFNVKIDHTLYIQQEQQLIRNAHENTEK